MKNEVRIATVQDRLREALRLSSKKQVDLVRDTGIDKGSISSYLSGRYEPKQEAIYKLSLALNVSEMWLWGYDVPMERKVTPNPQLYEDKKSQPADESGLTESQRAFIQLAEALTDEQAAQALRVLKAILGDGQ